MASRLIALAISLLGSREEVRALLKCSASDFRKYCDGSKEPSWPEIDRLVDLIAREQGARIEKNRAFLDEIRRKRRLRG
jgi:hypothetical protein